MGDPNLLTIAKKVQHAIFCLLMALDFHHLTTQEPHAMKIGAKTQTRSLYHPMADVFTTAERSRIMASVRSRGNRSTEKVLVSTFRHHHITGWRRHYPISGKPDFAFPRAKIAIFLDGCFWHGCPRCGSIPTSNRAYWEAKISRNIKRDQEQTAKLMAKGWMVLRIWEHELRGTHLLGVIKQIKALLAG